MTEKRAPKVALIINSNSETVRALTGNYDPAQVNDTVDLAPTLRGHIGRAWAHDLEAARAFYGVAAEADGTVAMWCVEAPWAHPIWHSYSIVLVHLRPMPDGRPTLTYLEGATHEMWVYALAPDTPREPAIRGRARPAWLSPSNFAAQLVEPSDEAAQLRIQAAVQDVIDGRLSPDSDHLMAWAARFGSNMVRK